MNFSKLMLKSRFTVKTHKSFNRLSNIVLRVVVFISFILLNVLSQIVDETGIVITATSERITIGNVYFNGNISIYRSTIVFKFESLSISTSKLVVHRLMSINQLSFVL